MELLSSDTWSISRWGHRGTLEPQQGAAGRVQKTPGKCFSLCPEDDKYFKLLPHNSVATFNYLFNNGFKRNVLLIKLCMYSFELYS